VHPKSAKQNEALFDAIHVKNLKVLWKSSRLVDIQYDEALIDHFQNKWQPSQNLSYIVELRLAPTAAQFSLPARDRVFP
jgi:hypothetical protein